MGWFDLIGFVGSFLTLSAYSMRSMKWLRIVGIGANLFTFTYGIVVWAPPIFVLHGVLLPLNLWRLWEILVATRRLKQARSGDDPILALRPFLTPSSYPDGHMLFEKGDAPTRVYYIESGAVTLPEVEVTLPAGTLFGEMAFFAADRTRTTSARCTGACRLLEIDETAFMKVYQQHPEFGFYVIRLMAQRLLEGAQTRPEVYASLAGDDADPTRG